MAVRRRVIVTGRVQGVFFRDSCRRRAANEGVGGFVRNLPGGEVEAAFEGEPAAVERMVEWCRRGPPSARVDGVKVLDEEPRGEQRFGVG